MKDYSIIDYAVVISGIACVCSLSLLGSLWLVDKAISAAIKHLRFWSIVIEYFIYRKTFLRWLQGRDKCKECGDYVGLNGGPDDGWQLEDGKTVCQPCCVKDIRKKGQNA